MSTQSFTFRTDTATLCIFDTARLQHRLDAAADWWCYPLEEPTRELNEGNAAFFNLGADGFYAVSLSSLPLASPAFELHLFTPSGRIFIGAGEETTSEGMEPDCTLGGIFLAVPHSSITVQASMLSGNEIQLAVLPCVGTAKNAFNSLPSLAKGQA